MPRSNQVLVSNATDGNLVSVRTHRNSDFVGTESPFLQLLDDAWCQFGIVPRTEKMQDRLLEGDALG